MSEYGFNMLARAKPVDSKVYALTVELTECEVPNLHQIGHSAAGTDLEVGKYRMLRIEITNPE